MKHLDAAVPLRFNTTGAISTTDAGTLTGAMASTNTIYTVPLEVRMCDRYAIQFVWASGSSPVGTLTVDFSLDGTTFTDSGVSFTAISGAAGSRLFNVTRSGGECFVRFKYVNVSGTATASAVTFIKGAS
jgi:hypothetical protein